MAGRSVNEHDPLEDFQARTITLDEASKRVYVAGARPAVILMTEMPGISAEFRVFANKKGPNQSSPVTRWLRALAALAHGECGGPGG